LVVGVWVPPQNPHPPNPNPQSPIPHFRIFNKEKKLLIKLFEI